MSRPDIQDIKAEICVLCSKFVKLHEAESNLHLESNDDTERDSAIRYLEESRDEFRDKLNYIAEIIERNRS